MIIHLLNGHFLSQIPQLFAVHHSPISLLKTHEIFLITPTLPTSCHTLVFPAFIDRRWTKSPNARQRPRMNLWLAAAAAMAALAVLAAANPGWNMDNDDEDAKEQKKPEVNNGV